MYFPRSKLAKKVLRNGAQAKGGKLLYLYSKGKVSVSLRGEKKGKRPVHLRAEI